ncbi:MAG TPA: DUF1592 domain-containing protein [Chthoniobacteraceae bacterium]|nr:DUF1592 domain-containing protein [Chthoniobacteraceae bacterium]
MSPRYLAALSLLACALVAPPPARAAGEGAPTDYLESYCFDCHDGERKKGNLDLTALHANFLDADSFARWVKVYDRVAAGEMPPKKKERPPEAATAGLQQWLKDALLKAEQAHIDPANRTTLRRMTRGEYENTVRDLLDLSGIMLQAGLPADGVAHGFDTNSDALEISHVNMAKYLEAADRALDMAIATQPVAPTVQKERMTLMDTYLAGYIGLQNGECVLLKDLKPDPNFHIADSDQTQKFDSRKCDHNSSVGIFRHEDESFLPQFGQTAILYPGRYRIRTSLWSFGWDKGQVLPARGTEAARLSAIQLRENGRGANDGSRTLGYYDAPSLAPRVHDFETWLNYKEIIGLNVASLAPITNYNRKDRAMGFTGPGIANDWLEIEGPLNDIWPPESHRRLFGELAPAEFNPKEHPETHPPLRPPLKQEIIGARNRVDRVAGIWTVQSAEPLNDARRLLASFLPRAFRHPVEPEVLDAYVAQAEERLKAGDCFELAMRYAFRAALCSTDFLYHVEPAGKLDEYALASRLSYFFWNSMPDDTLTQLAAAGKLHEPENLRVQTERLLKDAKAQRFVEDFTGQWLRLRELSKNDPDKKLYPEFSPYLQDCLRNETIAYFRALVERDLDAGHLVRSEFGMLNEKLGQFYDIPGIQGSAIREVALPPGCPRGPFLTQGAILKVTANGTTTSPVVRGAFVMARLLGQPPEPPPPNTPAVEPDVRGAKTIREQLDKHRNNATCAACHARIDPPGFALESFDVIGGRRDRYRAIGEDTDTEFAPRPDNVDPAIRIRFKLAQPVDASGNMADGRKFTGIADYQALLASEKSLLLRNLAQQFAIYATGREISFGDRLAIAELAASAEKKGGGIRTLLHGLVESTLFQQR